MRAVLTLAVIAALSVVTSAQLPRPGDLADLVRKAPSLDGLLKNRPLETTFDDTRGPARLIDRLDIKAAPGDLRRLPRTSNGSFMLQPGLWEGTVESYCLRPATWSPGVGDGYLWAPMKGGKANVISTILRNSVRFPQIPRGDIQMLLWAILSRTRVNEMPPKIQTVARTLLPAGEVNSLNVNGLQAMEMAERTNLFRGVTGPIREILEGEARLRYEFSKGNANYAEIERIAVLSGAPPAQNKNAIRRGQWAMHPGGYFVRYYPDGFAKMRVQVLKPPAVKIVRDQLNRIVSVQDSQGTIETTYNDAIAPRPHPRNKRLKAYAFKTIRVTTNAGPGGKPEVREFRDKGYTFHQSSPRRRGVADLIAAGAEWVRNLISTPVEARRQFDWDGWIERGERAQELYEDAETLRDHYEENTTTGDASSVDDAADAGHYRDGVIVVVVGDTSERVDWISQMHERFNNMLEHATNVLNGLPGSSDTGGYDPGGGVAIPSGGGQSLGGSGRFY